MAHPRNTQSRRRPGFTLVELLVVIAILVLVIAIAVPTISALSGGRSVDAAANQVAAALARARTEALGLQEVRGILFVKDPGTARVGLILVGARDPAQPDLDAVPDVDMLLLPSGVELQTIDDAVVGSGANPQRDDDGYLGYNPPDPSMNLSATGASGENYRLGGVILFDGHGRLISRPYRFVWWDGFQDSHLATVLKVQAGTRTNGLVTAVGQPYFNSQNPLRSQTGFVIFDSSAFTSQFGSGRNVDADPQLDKGAGTYPSGQPSERAEESWIDQNGVPFLVNRYSGAILRAS